MRKYTIWAAEYIQSTNQDARLMKQSQSLVLFVVDGLRPDSLQEANTPRIDSLMNNGAYTFEAQATMPTITLPCMVSMFFGTGPERHGILTNTWKPMTQPIPSIIDLAHSAAKTAASFYNWEPLRDLSMPGSLDASFFLRNCNVPQGDTEIAEIAAHYLSQRVTDLAFLYLGYADIAGHDYGWMTERYLEAVENADAAIGKVLDALRTARFFDDTFFIVTSDHGGHEKTHGTSLPEDMNVPLIISGPGVPSGIRLTGSISITDTAPTISTLLEIDRPKEWTGHVIADLIQRA